MPNINPRFRKAIALAQTTGSCCTSWWRRTTAYRFYEMVHRIISDKHNDGLMLLMCFLIGYYSWRLAVVAHWIIPWHFVLPGADTSIGNASARLTSAGDDFWGNAIPPGVTCITLLIASLGGFAAIYTRNAGMKIGVMLVGIAFYLRAGGLLWYCSPDHTGGVAWLIQAGTCYIVARAQLPVYVADIADMEKIVLIALDGGIMPKWSAVPWIVRRRLEQRRLIPQGASRIFFTPRGIVQRKASKRLKDV